MPYHRLRRPHRNLLHPVPKQPLERPRLDEVPDRRRRPMRVHIPDIFRRELRILQRRLHHPIRPVAVFGRLRDVLGIGRQSAIISSGPVARSRRVQSETGSARLNDWSV